MPIKTNYYAHPTDPTVVQMTEDVYDKKGKPLRVTRIEQPMEPPVMRDPDGKEVSGDALEVLVDHGVKVVADYTGVEMVPWKKITKAQFNKAIKAEVKALEKGQGK